MMSVILGTVAVGLFLIGRLDQTVEFPRKVKAAIILAGMAGSALLNRRPELGQLLSRLLLSLFIGCLLLACVTDLAICQVHNFVWWIAGSAGGLLFLERLQRMPEENGHLVFELAAFCVIQLVIFGRLYGRADCYAFCVCAVMEAALGIGLKGFLGHMLFSFGFLSAKQAAGKNIGHDGNLRRPVPFLPYITAGMYLVLIFENIRETVVPLS